MSSRPYGWKLRAIGALRQLDRDEIVIVAYVAACLQDRELLNLLAEAHPAGQSAIRGAIKLAGRQVGGEQWAGQR